MTVVILYDGEPYTIVNRCPGNIKASTVLAQWMQYMGIPLESRHHYSGRWVTTSTDWQMLQR